MHVKPNNSAGCYKRSKTHKNVLRQAVQLKIYEQNKVQNGCESATDNKHQIQDKIIF